MIGHVEKVLKPTITSGIQSIMTKTLIDIIPKVNDIKSRYVKVIPTTCGVDPIVAMGVDHVEVDTTLDPWEHEVGHSRAPKFLV